MYPRRQKPLLAKHRALQPLLILTMTLVVHGCSQQTDSTPPRLFSGEASVSKRKLCSATRDAVEIEPGTTWSTTLSVPADAELDISFGVACPTRTPCAGEIQLTLNAKADGSTAQLLTEVTLARNRGDGCWRTERVDFSHLSGTSIDLELSVRPVASTIAPAASDSPSPVLLWAEPLWKTESGQRRPNVLLISIDTLRADHLGAYGYDRETSPELDAFSRDAVLFRQAVSQATWTTPSHMTLMTSLYPSSHRVNQPFPLLHKNRNQYRTLPSSVPTLARALRDNGYRTVALTAGPTLTGDLGFYHGFDHYRDHFSRKLTDEAWSELAHWLDRLEDLPFFLFFHTFEVHEPLTRRGLLNEYLNPEELEDLEAKLRNENLRGRDHERAVAGYLRSRGVSRRDAWFALYDSAIRHADEFMGRLFEDLKHRGLYENTLIIVTSDHGEEFGERDPKRFRRHGYTVHNEMVGIPLMIRIPAGSAAEAPRGEILDSPVGLIDVAPTILDILALPVPTQMQGQSLATLMQSTNEPEERWALSEATSYGPEMKAIRNKKYKYVAAFETEGERTGIPGPLLWEKLFDVEADPGEVQNIGPQNSEMLRSLRRRLAQSMSAIEKLRVEGEMFVVDPKMQEELRALGYIE